MKINIYSSFVLPLVFIILSCNSNNNSSSNKTSVWFDSVINNANEIFYQQGKGEAVAFINSARATGKMTELEVLYYWRWMCNIYTNDLHDYNKCILTADSISSFIERNKNFNNETDFILVAYNYKADALLQLGNYITAYDFYYKAQKRAIEHLDTCGIGRFSYNLGMVLYKQKKYAEALKKFVESYNNEDKCKDKALSFFKRQELLDNIALCYYNLRLFDSALLYYSNALYYLDTVNIVGLDRKREEHYIESAKAVVHGNIADVYSEKGKIDSAIILLKMSIDVNLKKSYTNTDAETDQIKLAKLYYKLNNFSAFITVLKNVVAEVDTVPNPQAEVNAYQLLWQYYGGINDSISSYRYLLKYYKLSDSINMQHAKLMASDMELRIKNLDEQNNLYRITKVSEERKIFNFGLIIVVVFAFIVIFIEIRNLKTLKKFNKKIGEQKEELQSALGKLEERNKDNTRILHSVAHDVMSPINAIISITELLLSESENLTEEQIDFCNLINQSSRNSIALSKDIIEAAENLSTQPIVREVINISELLKTCVDLLKFKAAEKGIQINVSYFNKEVQAYVNKEKIWRVLNNLISNAIKFSYENSVIEVVETLNGNNVLISVKDYGKGISEKNKSMVFDMFTKAKTPGTKGEKPHGLGLSICLNIAKAHRGNIWLESEVDKGSTFYFEFPINADV